MIELDPGHRYEAEHYPAIEGRTGATGLDRTIIQFRKRIGEGYPGNLGSPKDGTSTQDLLRILIKRALYVDGQDSHPANKSLIERCQQSIFDLEERAAFRRGSEYYRNWFKEISRTRLNIEDIPVCKVCGHIFCSKHEV